MRLARFVGALLTLVLLAVASGPVGTGARTGATAVDTSAWSVLDRGGDAGNHEAQCTAPATSARAAATW